MSRIIFMGTPEFALEPLKALVENGCNIIAVYSQPPRPKGRGHAETPSPVHVYAKGQSIPVFTPVSLKSAEEQQKFAELSADLAIVAAYGLLLPKQILEAPKLGCINIHASLLPRWRGAAPIHRAIEAGDHQTGITIMQMDEGLDTGAMLYTKTIPIEADDTSQTLHAKMLPLAASTLLECLPDILSNNLKAIPQPLEGISYAKKLKKDESLLDFNQHAEQILRKIHALTPWPGTIAVLDDEPIKILEAEIYNHNLPFDPTFEPGTWIVLPDQTLLISCKNSAICLKILQRPGAKSVSHLDFLNGYRGKNIIFEKYIKESLC